MEILPFTMDDPSQPPYDADPLYPAHYTCGSHDEQLLCRGNGNRSGAPVSGRVNEVGDAF